MGKRRSNAEWGWILVAAALTVALAAVSVAQAQDEPAPEATSEEEAPAEEPLAPSDGPVDPDAPDLPDGIQVIPLGSLIVLPPAWVAEKGLTGDKFTVPQKSYSLPEPMYDTALTKARQLEICRPALDECTEVGLLWLEKADNALAACQDQFDADEKHIDGLVTDLGDMETRAITAEVKLQKARTAAGVSWAITSGVVVGLVTTAIIVSTASP